MNRKVWDDLGEFPSDRADVHALIAAQAFALLCCCGAAKDPADAFCMNCRGLLLRAGLDWDLSRATIECYQQTKAHRSQYGPTSLIYYDSLVDVLAALRAGRWDGKRQRRSREDVDA